jgi:hypothetical protein
MAIANEYGTKQFRIGDKVWVAFFKEHEWKAEEVLIVGVNIGEKYCYTTDSRYGLYEQGECDVFSTAKEAEYVIHIIKGFTGGRRYVSLEEARATLERKPAKRIAQMWLQEKLGIGYRHSQQLLNKLIPQSESGDV